MEPARHLYIHVPFCARRCSYCDFAIAVRRSVPANEYISAISAELDVRLASTPTGKLSTIYLGGGTPSKLGADGLAHLLDIVRNAPGIQLDPETEITVEANPEDVTPDTLTTWMNAGVNRLSLGVQSFDRRTLAWMHRTHGEDAARSAMDAARTAGLRDISLDLIFALPQDLERNWERDLEQAIALHPDHLSVYGLTVEPHTPLGRWTARGEVAEAPEEVYADEFLLADRMLRTAGFDHYEVSNYSRGPKRSRHNSAYWRRVPYIGVGPSAHSFDGSARRWNEREYEAWKTRALRREDPIGGAELLDDANAIAEGVYLGLRTSDGLAMESADAPKVEQWVATGWAVADRGRIVLKPEGWLRLDSLAAALTAARSR